MNLQKLLSEVLDEITPKPEERAELMSLSQTFIERARRAAEELTKDFDVLLLGSLAKDTALSRDVDIDVFVLLPKDLSKEELHRLGLEIGRRTFYDQTPIERYADHPYLEVDIDGVKVSVVPAYRVEPTEWRSPVDRTYYHVEYVKGHLGEEQKGEVRLLKKFMKGVGTYGSEVRVKGFSGYLCELLTLYYGTFLNLLKAVEGWRPPIVLDLEDQYEGDIETITKVFRKNPLVVIDPVDKSRNVAAALSNRSLARFTSAARWFLREPSRDFFFPPPLKFNVESELRRRGDLLMITFQHGKMVEDTLYPQLERLAKKIGVKLGENGFKLLKTGIYSDFESSSCLLIELEAKTLPRRFFHLGPPPFNLENEEAFIRKNLRRGFSVWISDEGRWVALRERDVVEADELIRRIIDEGVVIPRGIRGPVTDTAKILDVEQIAEELRLNPEVRRYLEDFLGRSEFWIEDHP
ncbi:MAG: CCA tRNA nucleotidyltransferase [Candidatus Geothermarchaeales archaeon]